VKFLNAKIQAGNKIIATTKIYKKIILIEWFFVAGLTTWLLMIFMTILH
jgi:hypothetical protein